MLATAVPIAQKEANVDFKVVSPGDCGRYDDVACLGDRSGRPARDGGGSVRQDNLLVWRS
jgi:hypothetical protein